MSLKNSDELNFHNLIGTYKQLFCSICSTYCCNLHNIKDDKFCFDNPEVHKMDEFLYTYKSLIYISLLSNRFNDENKTYAKSQAQNLVTDLTNIYSLKKTDENYNIERDLKKNESNKNNEEIILPKEDILKPMIECFFKDNALNISINLKLKNIDKISSSRDGDLKILKTKYERFKNISKNNQIISSDVQLYYNKSSLTNFMQKIFEQTYEFNKIIELNKLQSTCSTIDIIGNINVINF